MLKEFWGVPQLEKKWFDLIKTVKSTAKDDCLYLVQITKTKINATDGRALISINRDIDWELPAGLYLMTSGQNADRGRAGSS